MEGQRRPVGRQGESAGKQVEMDYIQSIMRSLTDSSTSSQAPLPSQSIEEPGVGSSSYSFTDSYARVDDGSPGLNPWSYCPPPPELRSFVDSTEPDNWRTDMSSPQNLNPIQREILADFPWLNEELNHRRLMSTTGAAPASPSDVSFPMISSSTEESNVCTTVRALETPTDQGAWAESVLELQAFENSAIPEELPAKARRPLHHVSHIPERLNSTAPVNSGTPFNSESLASSLSDGEAEPKFKKGSKKSKSGEKAAWTTAKSEKRKRAAEQEDGEEAPSDDQETKEAIHRPRKKGGAKRAREPRYAIKTRTDTEVMDDGYKWRKYGQKAVKNSPHPRNYYRCTTPTCPVRKRVERCSEDSGMVVTTYEGTHTHQSPSFLRGPPGYPGGLQALLATLSHHYMLAGKAPFPGFKPPHSSGGFPLSNSELYRSSPPLRLSQLHPQVNIQEDLNLLRANEQLLRLRQEAAWTSSIKSEPSFQFPGGHGPSFSNVSSLSELSYDTTPNPFDSLNNSSVLEQLDGSQLNPLDYSSLMSGAGPFPSVKRNFDRQPEYVQDVVREEDFRAAPCSQDSPVASSDGGLLEDMLRTAKPPMSRA